MGATYTRQSSYTDGDVITAAHTNDEFDQLLAVFQKSTGHVHDGTDNEGGVIADLIGNAITIGSKTVSGTTFGTLNSDTTLTFNSSDTNSGVLSWDTSADLFQFSDDILIIDNEQLIFGSDSNVAISYDEATTDSLKIAATEGAGLAITLMADEGDDAGDEWKLNIADGGTLTFGNDIASAGTYVTHLTLTPNSTVASSTLAVAGNLTVGGSLTLGSGAELAEAELEMLDGITAGTVAASKAMVVDANRDIGTVRNLTIDGTFSDGNYTFDDSGNVSGLGNVTSTGIITGASLVVDNFTLNGTELDLSSGDFTLDVAGDIILNTDDGIVSLQDDSATFGSLENSSGNLVIKSGTTTALTFSGANATIAGDLTISGDDLTMGTNTSGYIMVADGTNFNPVAVSGDVTIASNGAVTIASTAVENSMLAGSIADSKLSTITTADKVSGAAIQIDGATDGTSITIADADKFLIDDGGATKYVTASQINAYTSAAVALDDISTGDAAVTLATSSGNITIDAQANNTDIIFKGTDATSDITMLTLDGSEAGDATFNSSVTVGSLLKMPDNTSAKILVADGTSFQEVAVSGDVTIANTGAVTIASSAVENAMLAGSIADTKLNTISTAGKVALSALEIDGGTDIGAALVDADLIVVDDGAGGTNRKAAMSRVATYIESGICI